MSETGEAGKQPKSLDWRHTSTSGTVSNYLIKKKNFINSCNINQDLILYYKLKGTVVHVYVYVTLYIEKKCQNITIAV